MGVTVDILGTGPSMRRYDWKDNTKKWGLAELYPQQDEKIELWFAMHIGQTCPGLDQSRLVDLNNFPLKETANIGRAMYFTNSICYEIGYALYLNEHPDHPYWKGNFERIEKIRLFGIDLDPFEEWAFERPGVAYWIAIARMMGVIVEDACKLTDSFLIYGYHGNLYHRFVDKCEDKIWMAKVQIGEHEKNIANMNKILEDPDKTTEEKDAAFERRGESLRLRDGFMVQMQELEHWKRWVRT